MPFRRTSVDSSQRTGFYSPKRSRVVGSRLVFPTDPDAAAYIAAVESADGQELEFPIKVAYNNFVLGCKSDGIWNAIKASCIMAGARTLSGAFVPLVGTAPTNINFSGAEDSSWNSVSLLLRGEGPDNSTTFTDSSPNPLTPTVNASSVLDILAASGKFGSGIKYTNTGVNNAYVRYSNPAALQFGTGDFTWECWIRPDAAPAAGFYNVLWDSRASGEALTDRLYIDFYPNGDSTFRCFANGVLLTSTTNLSVGVWYHVAVCKASGTTRLFINGTEEASTADTANYTNGTSRPILFNNVVVNQRGVNYSVDEYRVTKGVARYTSNFTPSTFAFPGSLQSDYSRTTGLVGDGSTKYLNSNRNNNSDPQDNKHVSIYAFTLPSVTARPLIGLNRLNTEGAGATLIYNTLTRLNDSSSFSYTPSVGFIGMSRNASGSYTLRNASANSTVTATSTTPLSRNVTLSSDTLQNAPVYSNASVAFYSIGESLDLALLDSRVTTLMADLALELDTDVQAYVSAVETADGQALELEVKRSYAKFIMGCKGDGIWTAIKASCIMAGARTLAGALTPLVGTAPTNNNFVAGDYNRTTGLVGDGSTKYLDTNRASNADPQDSLHQAVFLSSAGTTTTNRAHISNSYLGANTDLTDILALSDNRLILRNRNANGTLGINLFVAPAGSTTDFLGTNRAASSNFDLRYAGNTSNISSSPMNVSYTPNTVNHLIFARNGSPVTLFSDARICFYSIGESLDLALLDSRVTTLMADIAAAIP